MKVILASASPRRRELLVSIGLDFEVIPSHVPEVHEAGESPAGYVTRLSREKAQEVAKQHPGRWIVAADTIVVLGEAVLEKPADEEDARRMLGMIAGKTHVVYTGLTLLKGAQIDTEIATSDVTMLPLTSAEIAWYVQTGEPLDKAGAYAVQGRGAMFIDRIDGSYTNVVGLPLATLYRMLRRAGLDPLQSAGS